MASNKEGQPMDVLMARPHSVSVTRTSSHIHKMAIKFNLDLNDLGLLASSEY